MAGFVYANGGCATQPVQQQPPNDLEHRGRGCLSQLLQQWQQHHRMSPPPSATAATAPMTAAAPLAPLAESELQLQPLSSQLEQQHHRMSPPPSATAATAPM